MDNSTGRLVFPDVLKAILVFLVILGHSVSLAYKGDSFGYWNNALITFIYSFHMPMFIAISGFFFGCSKTISFKELFINKSKRLLLPICTIALIYIAIELLTPGKNILCSNPIWSLYESFTAYWFLDCLFVLFLIVGFFKHYTIIVSVLLIILYDYLPYAIFKDLQIVRQLPIFYLAYLIGCHKQKAIDVFLKYKIHIFILSLACWALIILCGGRNLLQYSCWLRVILGIFSSVTMLVVFYQFYVLTRGKNLYLQEIGHNSLGIYIFHFPVLKILPVILNPLVLIVLSFLLLYLCSILTNIFRKTPLKILLLGELK